MPEQATSVDQGQSLTPQLTSYQEQMYGTPKEVNKEDFLGNNDVQPAQTEQQASQTPPEPGQDLAPKTAEPQQQEQPWEKRYRDLQSHTDRVASENDKLKQNLDALSLKVDQATRPPPEPDLSPATDDEFMDNARQAFDKEWNYRMQNFRKEESQRTEMKKLQEQQVAQKTEFTNLYNKDWEDCQKLWPDVNNQSSQLYQRAIAILKSEPWRDKDPYVNSNVFGKAARELGVNPVPQGQSLSPTPAPQRDVSYIAQGGQGGGQSNLSASPEVSKEQFHAMSSLEQEQFMRAQYLGQT